MVDPIVFFIASAICLTGAFGVILARNPVHSALMLVMTLFGIAVQFVAQEAHFFGCGSGDCLRWRDSCPFSIRHHAFGSR